MLPILLMILKITGIVILALLGLVLAVLLLVLFVPVRYGLSGSYYGKVQGTVKVTWLLHALSLKVTYEDELDVVVRVLGKRMFQKKEEAGKELEEVLRASETAGEELTVDFVESAVEEPEPESELDELTEDDNSEEEKTAERVTEASENSLKQDADNLGKKKKGKSRRRDKGQKGGGKRRKEASDSANLGIKEKFKKLKESGESLWLSLNGYKEKAVSFWNDERNQKTIRVILCQIKGILRHVLPRKVRGKAVFGFDNPSTTGKLLSVLSVVYAWYGDKLEIVPVFDRSILEVEGSLKGRVQAGVIAARGVRVLLNKNFRRLAWSLIKNGGK